MVDTVGIFLGVAAMIPNQVIELIQECWVECDNDLELVLVELESGELDYPGELIEAAKKEVEYILVNGVDDL